MRFEYFEPSSLEETRELLRRGEGHYKPFAGGTDVILQLRRHMTDTRGLAVRAMTVLRGQFLMAM